MTTTAVLEARFLARNMDGVQLVKPLRTYIAPGSSPRNLKV